MDSAVSFFKNRYSMTGLESTLNEEERAFQDTIHRFAKEVVRPIGIELDKLSAEDVVAQGSPFWVFLQKFAELGIGEMLSDPDLDPVVEARFTQILLEELAWGDAGLAVSAGCAITPALHAKLFENSFVQEQLAQPHIGCWGITEPDHGSDQIMHGEGHATKAPNIMVKIDGDNLIINGQKSAWVSNGPVATHMSLYASCDFGGAELGQCVVIVPLNVAGVSRGNPLEKMGQRPLPQGEVFFDNVTISKEWLLIRPEQYDLAFETQLAIANTGMGAIFTGLSRAAFEQALDYAHERKQGGVRIIEHQDVKRRLFDMFRKVEMSRALSHRANEYQARTGRGSLLAATATKVSVTDFCAEITSAALQMFGGNGLSREYHIEKMLRDARASQIEDGCNHVLSLKGGSLLDKENPLSL
jgi:alkylation response protein AidB-like acyl-CoA dehydrogenase